MAKPISTGRAGCSSRSPSYPHQDNLDSHPRPRRRRRLPGSSGPSPGLLSLLATLSASSTSVQGSPAPPSFLCPSLDVDPTSTRNTYSRGSLSRKIRRAPSSSGAGNTRHVPNKFEMDNNGRWRRVESYTLYGSTVCLTCQDATTSVPSVDDQIQGPASSSVPQSTPSATTYNIHDDLPPGWKPAVTTGGSRTTLILALSLVLAFLICFLIISFLFWRKTKRRKRKQNDVDIEMKARKRRRGRPVDDVRESMLALEREVKVKQKIWSRATARWKANARYTARQRRGKRITSTTRVGSPQSSCATLDRIEDTQPAVRIPASSPTLTRRSSLESLYTGTSAGDATANTSSPQEEPQADGIAQVPLPSPPPSPPAYHLRISVPKVRHSSEVQVSDAGGDGQSTSLHLSPNESQSASSSNIHPPDPSDTLRNMSFFSQRIHAAHIATDDKALLARLADLASAPPDAANSSQSDSATFHVSVPIWQDEELEDFADASYDPSNRTLPASRQSSRSSSPAPLFPPPPSKGKMAAPSFYDYPYSFEDISVEPDPGPSAPPFEEPTCPLDMPNLTPSAPPLPDTAAAYYFETYASAPPVTSDSGDATELSQQQHIPTSDHTESRRSEPSADSFVPLVQGPVASDGTPPSYHP